MNPFVAVNKIWLRKTNEQIEPLADFIANSKEYAELDEQTKADLSKQLSDLQKRKAKYEKIIAERTKG